MKRFESFIKCDTLCMPFDERSLKKIGLLPILIKELCQRLVERKWLREPILFSKLISAQIFTTSRSSLRSWRFLLLGLRESRHKGQNEWRSRGEMGREQEKHLQTGHNPANLFYRGCSKRS